MRNEELNYTYFFPEIIQVVPTDNFEIYAYFNDGSVHFFDVKPFITKGSVFEKISDIDVFKKTLTIIQHNVAWDIDGNRNPYTCIDLDPFEIFDTERVPCPFS
ncbi:MAG: DUF2442 domain-containing protein [Spirochaetales bacterium]